MSTNNTTESPNEDATKSSSSSSYSVIILGDAFADLYCFLEGDLPKEAGGDTRLKHPIRTVAGGSGLNTATHLKSLDANNTTTTTTNKKNVCLYTALNDTDPYGILLHQHADQYGFSLYNCCSVKSDESSTGHCAVLVANGDRSFLTHLGVMEQFDAQEHIPVDVICETTTSSLHVHVSGYYNIAGFWNGKLKQTIQQIQEKHKATKTKVVTSLLCQYDATEQWDGGLLDLLPLIDYLFVNEIEATKIARSNSGSQVSSPPIASTNKNDDDTTEEDVFLKSVATFFDSVSPGTCVILTLGPRGACALKGGTIVAQQAAPMTLQNPLDPTGAGDAFIAGFLHGIVALAKEQEEEEEEDSNACIRRGLLYGCVVGTSCVMIVVWMRGRDQLCDEIRSEQSNASRRN